MASTIRSNKLLASSRAWLISALDPFHDFQYDLSGLPDPRSAPSVVQLHNQVYTLTAPANAAANWDASITYTGFSYPMGVPEYLEGAHASAFIQNYDHAALTSLCPFASLNIRASSAGDQLWQAESPILNSTNAALGDSTASNTCDAFRLIGVAVEIVNSTAKIYKQGAVTVAMLPDTAGDHGVVHMIDTNAAPWAQREVQSDFAPVIATDIGQLRLVPGSSTWEAADGVYMIPRMSKIPFNVNQHAESSRTVVLPEFNANGTFRGWAQAMPQASFTDGPTVMPVNRGGFTSGFTPMEAYFTGLSHETTLTITFRTIVEYFPRVQSTLLPLAHPSAPYDPFAFEVYSATVLQAPYAVPVGENSAGDYFRKVLRVLQYVAPAVGAALGGTFPLAMPISQIVGDAASGLLRLTEGEKKGKTVPAIRVQPSSRPMKPLPPIPKKVERQSAGASSYQTRR